MAETPRIRIDVDTVPLKDLLAQLKLLETSERQGALAAGTYARAHKDIEDQIGQLTLNLAQHTQAQTALYQSQQRVSVGFKGMATSLNDMSTSLRSRATPAVVSLSQVIQDAPYGIRGVANNIEYLTQQMILMRQAAGSGKEMIKALLSAMTGPMGILMAISIVTSLSVAFGDKLFPAAKKSKDEIEAIRDALKELPTAAIEGRIEQLQAKIASKEFFVSAAKRFAGKTELLEGRTALYGTTKSAAWFAGILAEITGGVSKEDRAMLDELLALKRERDKKILESTTETINKSKWAEKLAMAELIADERKKALTILGIREKMAIEAGTKDVSIPARAAEVKLQIERQYAAERLAINADFDKKAKENALKEFISGINERNELAKVGMYEKYLSKAGMIPGLVYPSEVKGVKEGMGKVGYKTAGDYLSALMISEELERDKKLALEFTHSLKTGITQATSFLAEGFVKAFNLGEGLIGRFAAMLMSAVAQALAVRATSSIFDWLGFGLGIGSTIATSGAAAPLLFQHGGWIKEPVVGMGMASKRIYALAEHGPEYVSSANRMGQSTRYNRGASDSVVEALGEVLNNSRLQAKGNDLVLVYDGAKRIVSRRRMK